MRMSRIVGGRWAGTTCMPPLGCGSSTVMFFHSGIHRSTASSSWKWPCSYRVIIATPVIGLVIEYSRQMASSATGTLRSRSCMPKLSKWPTTPSRTMATWAPAIFPGSMYRRRRCSPMRPSRASSSPAALASMSICRPPVAPPPAGSAPRLPRPTPSLPHRNLSRP